MLEDTKKKHKLDSDLKLYGLNHWPKHLYLHPQSIKLNVFELLLV